MVGKHIAFCPVEALLLYPFCPHLRANPKKELSLQQWTSSPCPDWNSELCVGFVGCVWTLQRQAGLEEHPADRVLNVQLVTERTPEPQIDLASLRQRWFNVKHTHSCKLECCIASEVGVLAAACFASGPTVLDYLLLSCVLSGVQGNAAQRITAC